jgi:hypothetical protein
MEACFQHPDRLAVEHCETCRRPLCGSCLWYAESGERLCPEHAADRLREGKGVIPPERYAEGIAHSQASAARPAQATVPYQGNSTDVTALISAVSGLMALGACFGLSWILPLMAFGLGLAGWLQAKDAHDPRRTQWLAGVGMVTGGLFAVGLVMFFVMMLGCMFIPALLASRPSPPIPTPIFPTLVP